MNISKKINYVRAVWHVEYDYSFKRTVLQLIQWKQSFTGIQVRKQITMKSKILWPVSPCSVLMFLYGLLVNYPHQRCLHLAVVVGLA
jgi:hypothetical protein